MKNVITRLNGGLGNQLFQFSAGLSLALRLNCKLKLDLTEFSSDPLRHYELDKFCISAEMASPEEVSRVIVNPTRFQRGYSRLLIKLGYGLDRIALKENKFSYNEIFNNIRHPVYLCGYWQSQNYFMDSEQELRKELNMAGDLGNASKKFLEEILQCASVSLHIRRGDYVTNPSAAAVHGICSLGYYNTAVNHIGNLVKNPVFFVFSDDLQWAKDNLRCHYPMQFVDANGPDRSVEDMWLMKSCKHHIIANSSFSWWGAWLNERPDKIVIAPRVWFLDRKIDTRDLIPEKWHRL